MNAGETADSTPADTSPSPARLAARRLLFALLVVATVIAMLAAFARVLAPGGIDAVEVVLIAAFAVVLPWIVIGFWNAVIGFLIMRFSDDPVAAVLPAVRKIRADAPIAASTAILVCVRNEAPERVVGNLRPLLEGLVAAGAGDRFRAYVLSDTNDADVAADEDVRFSALAAALDGRLAVVYRRRADNAGFKAGNIAEFCARFGDRHDLAVTLDADSLMPAEAVLRMVRLMEAAPRIGILQALVIGLPATGAFPRLFQFSMRLGMRSWTIGSAWWQADCGPYWGHNAVLRLKPFIAHCELSALPGTGPLGGHVLSHDQIEAVLMRRAKYEVRVLPEETLGFEANPPTLMEFVRRDLRWCQGNMQYWRFLALPRLRPVSRAQLMLAILMFLGSPAWVVLTVVGTLVAVFGGDLSARIDLASGLALFALVITMWFSPQLASALDVLTRPGAADAFGGRKVFVAGAVTAMAFMQLVAPIMWVAHTIFLAGLPFGRAIGWGGQARDDHAVPLAAALRLLWPQTLLGGTVLTLLALVRPEALPFALVLAAGPALAVPLATITASPAVGRLLRQAGLARLPEETTPPAILRERALTGLSAPATAEARAPSQPAGTPKPPRAGVPSCSASGP